MPRPKRPEWTKITITVSKKIAQEIRLRSAELNIEMGTFVDQTIRDHGLIPAMMDRELANDVLKAVSEHPDPAWLVSEVTVELERQKYTLDKPITPASLGRMAARWAREEKIPQPWKWAMYFVLVQGDWEPLPQRFGMLKGFDWFKR
jgi:hypothetical protein